MSTKEVSQDQILQELHALDPERWAEVLDFIGYLRSVSGRTEPAHRELSARELLQSGLVGIWADRDDIGDSLSFARQLRKDAEHRGTGSHDPA